MELMGWSAERLARDVDRRTVVTLVVLDLITYGVLYWGLLPAFAPVLAVLPVATVMAVSLTLSVVRLGLVGFFAARSLRARRGLARRGAAVPSILVGAVAAMLLQLVLGLVASALMGTFHGFGSVLLSVGQWLVFPLVGVLFVSPGPADRRWRRAPAFGAAR